MASIVCSVYMSYKVYTVCLWLTNNNKCSFQSSLSGSDWFFVLSYHKTVGTLSIKAGKMQHECMLSHFECTDYSGPCSCNYLNNNNNNYEQYKIYDVT